MILRWERRAEALASARGSMTFADLMIGVRPDIRFACFLAGLPRTCYRRRET